MDPTTNDEKSTVRDDATAIREKIDSLIDSARELYISDPHQASSEIEEAYNLSKSLSYDFGIGESLRVMGNVAWVQGEVELAVGNFRGARAVFEKLKNNERLTLVFKALGRAYHSLSDSGNSLRYYHLALDTAEMDKNDENTATSCYGLGFAYYHALDYPRALAYFQKGMVMYEALGDKFGTAIGYNNFADICLKISDVEKALNFALKALDLLEENNSQEEGYASEFHITIGDVYLARDDQDRAYEHYKRALKVASKAEYLEGQIFSNTKIGELKSQLHLYDEARIYLEKAFKLAREAGIQAEERKCRDLLAKAQPV